MGEQWRRKWHAAAVSGGDERIGEDLRGSSQVEVQRMSGGGEISLAVPEHLQSTLAWSQVASPTSVSAWFDITILESPGSFPCNVDGCVPQTQHDELRTVS